jgi:hypothetical protein
MANSREQVEYIEVSKPDFGVKQKIQIFQGGNGDFYLTICPYNHNGGNTIRLETSGGAITRNPRLVQATNLMYLAIAEENDTFDEIMNDFKVSKHELLQTKIGVVQNKLKNTYGDNMYLKKDIDETQKDIYKIREDLEEELKSLKLEYQNIELEIKKEKNMEKELKLKDEVIRNLRMQLMNALRIGEKSVDNEIVKKAKEHIENNLDDIKLAVEQAQNGDFLDFDEYICERKEK